MPAIHSRPCGFWPRPTNTFGSATLCTPTSAGAPLSHRRPRVCRQTDGVRAGIACPTARGRVPGTFPAVQHVFGGI